MVHVSGRFTGTFSGLVIGWGTGSVIGSFGFTSKLLIVSLPIYSGVMSVENFITLAGAAGIGSVVTVLLQSWIQNKSSNLKKRQNCASLAIYVSTS